jgi:hypothetical protein
MMRVVSDLMTVKRCSQDPEMAIVAAAFCLVSINYSLSISVVKQAVAG